METMEAEGHWTSMSEVYTSEEADFMALFLNNQLSNAGPTLQNFWLPHESPSTTMNTNYFSLELSDSNLRPSFSRGTTSASSSAYSGGNNNISQQTTHSFDFFSAGDQPRRHGEAFAVPDQKIKACSDHIKRSPSQESSAKRPRRVEKVDPVGKRYAKSKKKQKLESNPSKSLVDHEEEEEEKEERGHKNGVCANGNCSSSTTCCSEDESINGGQEMSGGDNSSLSPKEPNSDAKARARRGSATDPQSLYARKRRERINERLKILQNLVPNGTKVDISTMLEEAVQYVKFLQLQIKLLSSDELWMYAPIAYNGKDIGLEHLKLRLTK